MSKDHGGAQLQSYLEHNEYRLTPYLRPSSGLSSNWLIRIALRESFQNSALQNCNPRSVLLSLMVAAELGLDPSGVRGEAYLVPFKGQCTLMPGYRGLVRLANESGYDVRARIVRERDGFDCLQGTVERIEHRPALAEPGDVIGAYAIADRNGHQVDSCVMGRDELDRVRATAESRGRAPAWKAWPEEMYRKTPLRRLCKTLRGSLALERAIIVDNAASSGQSLEQIVADVIPAESAIEPEPVDIMEGLDTAAMIDAATSLEELTRLAPEIGPAHRDAYKKKRAVLEQIRD